MTYPYVAWQTYHRRYGAPSDTPQVWFATKKSGAWATTLVYAPVGVTITSSGYDYVSVANNGPEFLLAFNWGETALRRIFRSLDEGATWEEVPDARAVSARRLFRCQGMWVSVGTYGVEYSADGITWEWPGDPVDLDIATCRQNQIACDAAGRIHLCAYSYSSGGIFYAMTPDLGASWVESMPITDPYANAGALAVYGDHVLLVSARWGEGDIPANYGVVWNASHDGGQTWDSEGGAVVRLAEANISFISDSDEALGFGPDGAAYLITNGYCHPAPDPNDSYRVWAYRWADWETGGNTWSLETIGTWHEGVCAATDPETGEGLFLTSFPGFLRTDPYPATIWHNQLAELGVQEWQDWTVLQQRTPEPLTYFAPWGDSPDHWLLAPMASYAPPPNWYTEDSGGYSFWW